MSGTKRKTRHDALQRAREFEKAGLPFSLACGGGCERGDEAASIDEALAMGWTEIEVDHTGFSWNYIGLCPDFDEATNECQGSGQGELF